MAKEKLEDVSTESLLKRKKFFTWILGVYIGLILVFIALVIYGKTQDKFESPTLIFGAVTASMVWLPIFIINSINKELKRREDK